MAAALGLPVNTVRTHLHRGRARLREALQANDTQHAGKQLEYAGKVGVP